MSSSAQRRISFSAEDNGSLSLIERLRQSAKDMSKDMIADAVKYSNSAKEQNKYIEDQIRLIEKRNSLEKQGRMMSSKQTFDSAIERATTKEARDKLTQSYKKEIAGIQSEYSEDSMQTKLLREIIDTLKMSTKEEIREEKRQDTEQKGFFSRIFGSKRAELSPDEAYKKSQEEDAKGERKESENEQRRKSGVLGQSSRTFNTAAAIGVQPNEVYMAAAAMALIPVFGSGLSTIANKVIADGSRLQEGRLSIGRILGNPNMDMGGAASALGVDQAEFLTYAAQMSKNRGYSSDGYALGRGGFADSVEGAAMRMMGTEQRYGVSRNSLLGFDRLQRLDSNRRDTAGDVQNLIKYLKDEGAFGRDGKDMASLEEYISIQTKIMSDQSKTLESINTNTNASVIASFQRIGGTFANPLLAGDRIASMNGAITNPNNDFKQAMVYSTLRKIRPDADLFELKKMQEEGIYGRGVLSGTMKDLTNRGGSEGNKKLMLMEFFGLSANQADAIFSSYNKDNTIFDSIGMNKNEKWGMAADGQFVNAGAQFSSILDGRTAKMTNISGKWGEKGMNVIDDELTRMEKSNSLNGYIKDLTGRATSGLLEASARMADTFGKKMDSVVNTLEKKVESTFSQVTNNVRENFKSTVESRIQGNPTKIPARGGR